MPIDASAATIETLDISSFHPVDFARGSKLRLDLLVDAAAGIRVPLLLARGSKAGKTLVAMAGVHGDEYEGVRAILENFEELDPAGMRGDLVAVPIANPPAFWSGTRISPIDGCNLARLFPGDRNGSATQVIAHHLAHSVIALADLFVDLHSGGVQLLMPTMVGYDAGDERSEAAAAAFGCPIVWGHPSLGRGRTISFAAERNIPWLYTEAAGAGRIATGDLIAFRRGLINLLRHLEILSGEPEVDSISLHLFGSADIDRSVCAAMNGFFVAEADLLDPIAVGDTIGRLVDVHGQILEQYSAPVPGVLAMLRAFPVVRTGDPLFLIAETRR